MLLSEATFFFRLGANHAGIRICTPVFQREQTLRNQGNTFWGWTKSVFLSASLPLFPRQGRLGAYLVCTVGEAAVCDLENTTSSPIKIHIQMFLIKNTAVTRPSLLYIGDYVHVRVLPGIKKTSCQPF